MLTIKKNSKNNIFEIKEKTLNIHPMIKDTAKKTFDTIYTREMLRLEACKLGVKIANDTAKSDEIDKFNALTDLLSDKFNVIIPVSLFNDSAEINDSEYYTSLEGLPEDLRGIMYYTLLAHNATIFGVQGVKDSNGIITLYALRFSPNGTKGNTLPSIHNLYSVLKKTIPEVWKGLVSIDSVAGKIKNEWTEACGIIDNDTETDNLKKWKTSDKLKVRNEFILGLYGVHKLTIDNRITKKSPLDNELSFQAYFLMWLVSNGEEYRKNNKSEKPLAIASPDLLNHVGGITKMKK